MESWSPWKDYDPDMKVSYKGSDGTIGAIYEWIGNEDVGTGSQTIVNIVPNSRIDLKLSFVEPWESESDVYFTFLEKDGNTEVAWGYNEKMPFLVNIPMTLMNVKGMIAKEYDKGLARLKEKCEG